MQKEAEDGVGKGRHRQGSRNQSAKKACLLKASAAGEKAWEG